MATHEIMHVEFAAADMRQSADFYGKLFGWPSEYFEGMDYWLYKPAVGPSGGFLKLTDAGPMPIKPGDVIVYVSTDDIEGSLAKAETLGGTILLNRTEIPGVGWYGLFADPAGTRVAVYTGCEDSGNNAGDTGSAQ